MTDAISAVQGATTQALPACTYNNGTAGVGATLTATSNGALTIDTYTVLLGDRVAVTSQAAPAQQGIYSLTTLGNGSTPWVLTRTTDFDTPAKMNTQVPFCVLNGDRNLWSMWVNTSIVTTIGTDNVEVLQLESGSIRGGSNTVFSTQSNTGVGNSNPSYTLDVTGTMRVYGTALMQGPLTTNNITPPSNSTTAFQVFKADGSTTVMDFDTTNGRVGIGTSSPIVSLDLSQNTDALALPVGTTGQRPSGTNGEIRYNSTNNALEGYVNGAWATLSTGSGGGFTSQNVVTGSRALNTVYQNTTGKTMHVNVIATYNANQQSYAKTDSSSSPSTIVANFGLVNTSVATFSFMVLNNNYYEIVTGGSATLNEWTEWY